MITERDLIHQLNSSSRYRHAKVLKGIGDDCAVFLGAGADGSRVNLVSTDTLMEGVHFDPKWHSPELLARKAVAVNLSDLAAMGGEPVLALLSMALPKSCETAWIEAFMASFTRTLDLYRVELAGGDTVRSAAKIALSVTIFGEAAKDKVIYRAGAKAGDLILVSNHLGDAAAGLELCRHGDQRLTAKYAGLVRAHLDPTPELALGRLLAESGQVTAMIDMSDGLATDLAHLCEQSGVGALLGKAAVPISPAMAAAARELALDPIELALTGGEDYHLLFTCAQSAGPALTTLVAERLGRPLFGVGSITAQPGLRLEAAGEFSIIDFLGFDHFS